MSLKQWAEWRWLRTHTTSPQEVSDLFAIVDRDLTDAESGISADWRFNIGYNAVLQLCTILLHASGYRPANDQGHNRVLATLPLILGPAHKENADYLNACRAKRNTTGYSRVGTVSESDATELVAFAKELRKDVLVWLAREHPTLLSKRLPPPT